jgi:serine/threonine protein kinase
MHRGYISSAELDVLGIGLSFSVSLLPLDLSMQRFFQERLGRHIGDKIVMKRMRYTNDEIQEQQRAKLYRACMMEVRALTHPPLKGHLNIVTLLGVAWEPDPDHHDIAWPMLVLEYAEEGTLKDYQVENQQMGYPEKMQLCEDVARGLVVLHGSGIVHGDLKSENVLIFKDLEEGRMVAKLADFGSSVVDYDVGDEMFLPAYTIPWNAPEYQRRIPGDHLQFADVYSFGMLVFRTIIDGVNPFKIPPFAVHGLDIETRAQQLKTDPEFRSLAAVMMSERCRPDVVVDDVCAILELTLILDPPQRDLKAAIVRLCATTHNGDPIAQGHEMQEFEYQDVCSPHQTTDTATYDSVDRLQYRLHYAGPRMRPALHGTGHGSSCKLQLPVC